MDDGLGPGKAVAVEKDGWTGKRFLGESSQKEKDGLNSEGAGSDEQEIQSHS